MSQISNASKTSKTFSAVTLAIAIIFLAFDVVTPDFTMTDTHLNYMLMLVGSFGVGGIYVKAIKEGFSKFQDYKQRVKDE